MVLTLIGGLVDLSLTQATRGENPKGENENGGGEGDGAPSSYLTGLLHISSFASGYKRAKPFSPRA
jgi:hypothetical protein